MKINTKFSNSKLSLSYLISEGKIPIITFHNFSDKDYISYNGETFLSITTHLKVCGLKEPLID